jgi:hypothetical protein
VGTSVPDDDEYWKKTVSRTDRARALGLGLVALFFPGCGEMENKLTLGEMRYLQSGKVTVYFILTIYIIPSLLFAGILVAVHSANGLKECVFCSCF